MLIKEDIFLDDILQKHSSISIDYDNLHHIRYADNQFYVLNAYLKAVRTKKE